MGKLQIVLFRPKQDVIWQQRYGFRRMNLLSKVKDSLKKFS